MNSINHFINSQNVIVLIITAALFILCLGAFIIICRWACKRYEFSKTVLKVIIITCVVLSMTIVFIVCPKLLSSYDHGGIKKLYIVKAEQELTLSVWFTKKYSQKVGADYDQKLMSFDLFTGAPHGSVVMVQRDHSDEYKIYWTSGAKAWGVSQKEGVQLLDLEAPKILATEKELLTHNPDLKTIQPYSGDTIFDTKTDELYIKVANNYIYKLKKDMSAVLVNIIPVSEASDNREWKSIKNWSFYKLKDSMGRHAHLEGVKCSPQSATLLEPEYIAELNTEIISRNKAWVLHKSAMLGDYDSLISLISSDGVEHHRINLAKIFEDHIAKAIYTYTTDDEILVFISRGMTSQSSVLGLTLTALRTDASTGKLLDRIDYF